MLLHPSMDFNNAMMMMNSTMNNINIMPTHTDVLLGRGVATNRHPGNENFRAIVAQHVVSSCAIYRAIQHTSCDHTVIE